MFSSVGYVLFLVEHGTDTLLFLLLFVDFIQKNPGFVAWTITGLVTIIGTMAWAWLITTNSSLRKLSDRVTDLEVALGHTNSAALFQKVNDFELENTREHGDIESKVEVVREKVQYVEDKIQHFEDSYPIQDLIEVRDLLRRMLSGGARPWPRERA